MKLLAHIRETDSAILVLERAVRQPPAGELRRRLAGLGGVFRLLRPHARAFGEAGNPDVVGRAAKGVEVHYDRAVGIGADRVVEHAAPREFTGRGAAADFEPAADRLRGQVSLDAVGDHVDHAADGVAAVE